ncbi:hypothetical protein R3I94_008703 [Phoxinus phoxinus]
MHAAEELGLLSESDAASTSTTEENEDESFVFSDQGINNQMDTEVFPSHSKAELETLHFLEDPRKDQLSVSFLLQAWSTALIEGD